MGATLKDVAALAKVHPSTVSRVLRNVENLKISEDTKVRIFKAIKEL
ncbi:MAG: LacI family DNA-binding transcriptional regulator, partial [Melioribacteraceae bacterium]|nr:LacI family DNA-binding transcriptional regulator [Melioribacteraceae bacterium]